MPIFGEMQAVVCDVELQCANCGSVVHLGVLLPLAQRSLRSFAAAMEMASASDPEAPLPECCGERPQATLLRYRFDEADLPALTYQPDRCRVVVDSHEVESEEELRALIGRPFSMADLHRLRLGSSHPVPYQPCPGVVTLPFASDEPAEELERSFQQAAQLFDDTWLEAGLVGPLSWTRAQGWSTWLGEPGERLADGRLLCANLLSRQALLDELRRQAPLRELQIQLAPEDSQASQLVRGEIQLMLDLVAIAELMMEQPLTLAEAVAWYLEQAQRTAECAGEAVEQLAEQGMLLRPVADGMAQLQSGQEASLQVNLASLARKSRYDADDLAEHIADMVGQVQNVARPGLGHQRGCGCRPMISFVVRAEEWASAGDAQSHLLSRPAWPGACKMLVEDCPHAISYLTDRQIERDERSPEELWNEAERNLPRLQVDVNGRALRAADGSTHAVLWLGHNLATLLSSEDLLRGLDRQSPKVRADADQLLALCLTPDLMVLIDPEADQEAALLEARRVAQLESDAPWDVETPLFHHVTFDRRGSRAGKFTAHPLRG